MRIVDAQQIREIDRQTIEDYGIASPVLMERAGLSVVNRIKQCLDLSVRVLVLAGSGNNGGDGLVVARLLHNEGWDVRVFLISSPEKLSHDCLRQYETAKKMGVGIFTEKLPVLKDLRGSLVIDAILGTGLNKPLRGEIANLADRVNRAQVDVVAVDIATGVFSDTGKIMGTAIRAGFTVTFGLPKVGHVIYPGAEYTGRLFVEDIGFPPALLNPESISLELIEKEHVSLLLPERLKNSCKGDYGHVLVIGGSVGKTGAPLLSARAALRSGAGLVTIGAPDRITDSLMASVLEEMTLPLPSTVSGTVSGEAAGSVLDFLHEKADVLAIGPGLSTDRETVEFVLKTISNSPVPMVVDADGLNALSTLGYKGVVRFLNKLRAPAVLTPHPGEMARLVRMSISDIADDLIGVAMSFSRDTGCCLVLKGVPTLIATPEGQCFINTTGNPGMATAGTGDVLTGIIASFTGQGLQPAEAALTGVYLHGLTGDIAVKGTTGYAFTANDLINGLLKGFRSLLSDLQPPK
ncbi:MAG: bifunctional NAD(P)H-hydrate repair enzyme Nnr [bacterium]|nr:MAG: bifunctional NAD(P)H-hydrate repair enzyme Nnr [bacterium]